MKTTSSLVMLIRLIREPVSRHPPNLKKLRGKGYHTLGFLLWQKKGMDAVVLDQCILLTVHNSLNASPSNSLVA